MHRVYRGRYFAIGAGYSFIFCRPNGARVVFVLPRAPIGFHAGQEKSKPDNQPDFPVFRWFLVVDNFISTTSHFTLGTLNY